MLIVPGVVVAALLGLTIPQCDALQRLAAETSIPPALGGALVGFVAGMWPFFVVLVLRGKVRVALRRQLVERGMPICIRCGYDLRGQTEPRCPECGTPFDERLLRHGG